MFKRIGIAGIVLLQAATFAGAAEAPEQKPDIYVAIKAVATDAQAKPVFLKSARYTTHAGEAMPVLRDGQHELGCAAELVGDPVRDAGRRQVLVRCSFQIDGMLVSMPTVVITDGHTGTMESGQRSGVSSFAAVFSASLSEERLDEALKAPVRESMSPVIRNLLSGL